MCSAFLGSGRAWLERGISAASTCDPVQEAQDAAGEASAGGACGVPGFAGVQGCCFPGGDGLTVVLPVAPGHAVAAEMLLEMLLQVVMLLRALLCLVFSGSFIVSGQLHAPVGHLRGEGGGQGGQEEAEGASQSQPAGGGEWRAELR